jgi:hypothetical protein
MALQKVRSAQIVNKDHITEAELSTLDVHQNIFLTKASSTGVKVAATSNAPAALTVQGILCSNTADTNTVTVSGSAGERQVYAVRNSNTDTKTWTIEVVSDDTPTSASLSRKVGTLTWDGSAITKIKWNLSSKIQTETQVPSTDGQTVFTLNEIIYEPGCEELLVFVNGALQFVDVTYTETNTSSVTFVTGSGIDTLDNLTFVKISSKNYLA